QWAFPGAEKFHPGKKTHLGIGHFPMPDEWLTELKADTILAFFGYNESFDGLDRVDNFYNELDAFVQHTLKQKYNGKSAPRLVLVSPIAFENLSKVKDLPNGKEENIRLAAYADAVKRVAAARNVGFV
ncbi:MAG: PVC-type heme-binding CxxCH protein, partial [Verrucomicrobiia bacterium]